MDVITIKKTVVFSSMFINIIQKTAKVSQAEIYLK